MNTSTIFLLKRQLNPYSGIVTPALIKYYDDLSLLIKDIDIYIKDYAWYYTLIIVELKNDEWVVTNKFSFLTNSLEIHKLLYTKKLPQTKSFDEKLYLNFDYEHKGWQAYKRINHTKSAHKT